MERKIYDDFRNPGMEYRGKPFWAWNGKLDKNELLKQIDIIKEMGFGGFFMHSRTGLETEYLGEEWFELINACSDHAKEEGLEAWLYDEDRWPSGSAGGIVTREEKYRASFLQMELYGKESRKACQWENAVAVFAVTLKEGMLLLEREVEKTTFLQEEEVLVAFYIKESECREVYNGYTYLDTMQQEAVEKFIEATHEKYAQNCGERLGKDIQGIFTDEPHRGALFSTFSEGRENAVPFTPGLFETFEERFGYDLKEKLPELFLKTAGSGLSRVTRDYIELCQELFLENFAVPIQSWLRKKNMLFTGHVLHEDSLTAQTAMQGSLMRFYEYMDYPGVDVLSEGNRCYWIVKQVVSVARQLNKKWVLSELYGCTGWQMSLQDYKYAGDWQALFGITLRCPHLSWYTMKGEAKRDYPASIFHQSAWYREYACLEDYFSRIHVLMTEGTADCSLLVLNPIESVWARAYAGAFEVLSARDEEIQRLEKQYTEVFERLVRRRIDFDYGEEDILSRHGRVEAGVLLVGECSYRKVLIAGMDTMRASTLALLQEFNKQGGQLIFLGEAPKFIDVRPSEKAAELAGKAWQLNWEEDFEGICASGNEIGVEGAAGSHILAQVRSLAKEKAVFLLNTDRNTSFSNVRIDLGIGNKAELWDARTGERTEVNTFKRDGRLICFLDFDKAEERLLLIDCREGYRENTDTSSYSYRLEEENICVLDMVTVITPENRVIPRQEVLRADRCLRTEFGYPWRSGEMLQPWYEKKQMEVWDKGSKDKGNSDKENKDKENSDKENKDKENRNEESKDKIHKITLRYDFYTEILPAELSVAIESLDKVLKISLNGKEISRESTGKWIDICYDRVWIPAEDLSIGENTLELICEYGRTGGIEAVYLLGYFGVSLQEENRKAVLTELPKTLRIGDITSQGLPFYSGKLSYLAEGIINDSREKGESRESCNGRLLVSLGDFGGACVKLIGEEEKILAFPPFKAEIAGLREIQLVFTRRNTFGPLHQLPAKAAAYGPDNFMTTGEQWSEGYVLLPQGLFTQPEIRFPDGKNR